MTTQRGVLKGSKISNNHSSFTAAAAPIIAFAKRLPEVTKVVISEIHMVGGGPRRLKFVPIPAGLRLVVRGPNSQQQLFIYTKEADSVRSAIEAEWGHLKG